MNELMRKLTREERAAMWLYHDEYAAQGLGAIEFYKRLGDSEKRCVRDMIKEILEAKPGSYRPEPRPQKKARKEV